MRININQIYTTLFDYISFNINLYCFILKKYILLLFAIIFFVYSNITAQVTANFTTPTASGCPNPFLAIVNDASTSAGGTINSWTWQITGPAGFVPVNSVNNQIAAPLSIPGLYNVSLTACDNLGFCDTRVINGFIEVFNSPTINYTISPTAGCPPLGVFFDGTINPGCGTVQSTVFDVRDGNIISNQTDFTHVYVNSGTYNNFIVSATNSCGCVTTNTINQPVTVTAAPIANFTSAQTSSCTAPFTTTITSSSSAPAGSVLTWIIPGFPNANGNSVTRTFPAGSFVVTLVIVAPNGCTDTLTRANYITVGNQTADFSASATNVCLGNSVTFQSLSLGTPLSYFWDIPGVGTFSTQNPVVNFPSNGTYSVSLTVTYTGGCQDEITRNNYITVSNPPTSSFNVTSTGSCVVPFTTSFTSTSTNSVQTSWLFPGGVPSSFTGNGPVSVTYVNPGTYSITMIDSASNGCVNSTVFNSVININSLTVSISADTSNGCIPLTTNFNALLNLPETINTISWSLPGSNIGSSNVISPSAIYNSTGCFDAEVTVSTLNGCLASTSLSNVVCAGTPPSGTFTFTPPSVCFEEEEVCFSYVGSDADTILWNFGDGSPSQFGDEFSSICYDYSTDLGNFTVTMIPFSYGCAGDTIVVIDAVEILGPISVAVDSFSCNNQNRRFFRSNSVDADSVFWNFGDPTAGGTDTSSLINPIWDYPSVSSYTVTLIAFNFTTGCSHSSTITSNVFTPDANFTANATSGCAPATFTFTNTSDYIITGSNNTRWDWDLSNGITFPNLFDTRGHVRARTFNQIGVYSISMRNSDPNGCLDTITLTDFITVHGITGGFTTTSPRTGCAPLTVSFQDTSIAPITGIASWLWNFGDPSTTSDVSSLPNPSYTYTNDGFYNVTLTVTDSFGCVRTYNYANYVNAITPNANFTVDRDFICNNQTVTPTNLSSGNGITYDWQFSGATPSSSNLSNPGIIQFNSEGIQSIFLEVTDTLGCTNDTTINISVFDLDLAGLASPDFSSCFNPPQIVNFTNLSQNNIDSSSVLWDFGNGLTSTNFNASTLYSVAGIYPITVSMSSLSGCSDTQVIDSVFIGGPFGAINLLSSVNEGCPCQDMTFEITTLNALAPVLLTGDGNLINLSPMVTPGDTMVDTVTYSYCEIGEFLPILFIQDGFCSGNINSNDTIFIDSLNINFDFTVQGLCDSGQVCFTDFSNSEILGEADIISWQWDFGDGNTSTDQSPCNFYNSPGNYIVELTVENTKGCIKTLSKNVHIPQSPIALFNQSDSIGCLTVNVNFTDLTTADDSTAIQSWLWDFGGGNTSIIQNPSFTFVTLGVNIITLTVEDGFGCSNTFSSQVEIFNLPIVQTSNDTTICFGASTQITANGGLSYSWSPDYFVSDVNIFNPIVSPLTDTTYFVTVTDTNGCVNTDSVLISVNRLTANFSTSNACEGDTALFTDQSTAVGGVIVSWSWVFDNGNTSNLQNPTNVFLTSGIFNVSLAIFDDLGCTQDTIIPVTIPLSPLSSFFADSVCLGIETNFNSSNSSAGNGNIIEYTWNFGDGIGSSNLANPSYLYATAGTFTVCLTIETDLACPGNIVTQCEEVIVYSLPVVSTSPNDTICLGEDLQLNSDSGLIYLWSPDYFISDVNIFNPIVSPLVDTIYLVSVTDINGCNSDDSVRVDVNSLTASFSFSDACIADTVNIIDQSQATGGTIISWNWNFGDSGTSITQNPSHVYNTSGTFDISLNITDDNGCVDSLTLPINISIPPFAQFEADSVCRGLVTNFNSSNSNGGSGNISTYLWDFGISGANSALANPSFTYLNAGTFTVCLTITSDINCDGNQSTECQDVIVYELPTALFSVDTACNGSANNFVNNSQSGTGSITQSFWNFGQAISDTLLQSGVNNTEFIYSSEGSYNATLIVTDEFGCTSTALRTALVYPTPIANFSFTSDCIGQPNEFVSSSTSGAINAINQYIWNFDEGDGFVIGDSVQLYSFNNSGLHAISHVVIDAFGCSDTLVQQLNIIAKPDAIITASNTTVCLGSSINFNAGSSVVQVAPASYEWDFTYNTGVDQVNPNPVYIPNASSTVALFVQDGNGCRDTAFVQITVLDIPEANFTFTPACEDIAISLNSTSTSSGSPLVSYDWTIDGTTQLNGQNIQYIHPTGNDTIEVLLIVTDANGCEDGVIYNIYVEEQPIIDNLVSEFTICAGDSVLLDLNDTLQFTYSGVGSFEWSPAAGVDNPFGESVILTPNLTTIYNVIGYGVNNVCPPDNDNQILVRVITKPTITIDATPNPIISGTSSAITVNVVPYNAATDSLIWTNGQNSLFPLLGGNVTATPTEETTYPLTLVYSIDTFRCDLDTFVTISVIDVCGGEIVYVPNIFTPNNDGRNDEFRISGYGLTVINKLIVFDRWGKVMYEGNNLPMVNGKMQNGWRGDNKNGKDCNSGVYVYLYEATCANGEIVKGNGNVTLIK